MTSLFGAFLMPELSESKVQDKRKIPPLSRGRVLLTSIPEVSVQDRVKWNDIVHSCNGIAGNDFFGVQRLGMAPAESKCALNSFDEWFPIEDTPNYGAKKCVCGKLLDYSQTGSDNGIDYLNTLISPDDFAHDHLFCDHDYDINIEPSPHFNDLLSRATNRVLMQFESDKAAGTSHSHRGFSPVSNATPFLSEPFQRFWAAIRRTSKRETVETVGSISKGFFDHRAKAAV